MFILALVAYWVTMPTTITLEDAGLFQMVCHLGGISHPPGYPLFTLLCQGMVQVPGVVNGNLVSALFAGLAVAVFHDVAFQLTRDRIIAYVASLAWAFGAAFWSQAIIIEVYSLAALMFMLVWWCLLRFVASANVRWWYAACLLLGLALTNHWPLMILSSLGLLIAVQPAWSRLLEELRSPVFVGASIGLVLLGLLPYVTLLFSTADDFGVYGPINSLDNLLKYIARSPYSDDHAVAGWGDKAMYAGWLVQQTFSQNGFIVAPFTIVGLVVTFVLLPRHVALSLLAVFLGSTYVLLLLLNFQYSHYFQAIFKPYPVIAYAAVAFWTAFGVRWLGSLLARASVRTAPALAGVVIIAGFVTNFPAMDRSGGSLIDTFARTVLNSLPPNAVLFVRGDNATGPFGYLHYVEGVRPDIELRDWENLVFPNRLTSPFAPIPEQDAAIDRYIKATTRPVFVIEESLQPRIGYGAFYQFNPGGTTRKEFPPALAAYVDLLVTVYTNDLSQDAHEQYFLSYELLQFSRHYIEYAIERGNRDLPPEITDRVLALQRTFPGRLVTLQALLPLAKTGAQKDTLLTMAAAAEQDIPEYTPPRNLARFYAAVARVQMLAPRNVARAIEYYQLSLRKWPGADNAAICELMNLYESESRPTERSELQAAWPEQDCTEAG